VNKPIPQIEGQVVLCITKSIYCHSSAFMYRQNIESHYHILYSECEVELFIHHFVFIIKNMAMKFSSFIL
jgi:hypothetical protein